MRNKIISIVVGVIIVSTVFGQSGTITVDISGIGKIEGKLAIGLFDKTNGFPEVSKAYEGVFLRVNKKNIQYIFSGIPDGYYAIAVFHDINNNGKLDKNFFGIPKEGYAFSNKVKATIGQPHFDDVKFKFDNNYTAKIIMKY